MIVSPKLLSFKIGKLKSDELLAAITQKNDIGIVEGQKASFNNFAHWRLVNE